MMPGNGAGGKMKDTLTFVVSGGGTGGHLFPGIAICRELEARFAGCRILFAVGRRRMESDILHRHGFEVRHISVEGIKGKGWVKKLSAISGLPSSLLQACRLIADAAPACVIGMGGYSSGPVCVAARLSGVPSVIHEQNSFPGLTNRLLCRVVDRVCVSFEESAGRFSAGNIVVTGNPVREVFFTIEEKTPREGESFNVLVVGGSLGARPVNDAFVDALALLSAKGDAPAVIHQTGAGDYDRVRERYQAEGLVGELYPFIDDMPEAYRRADLVVGRAGATTIFELAAAGRPAILIPYPFAADQHQTANAKCLAAVGGARIIMQGDLNGASLASALEELREDPGALRRMGAAARGMAAPGAAGAIVDQVIAVAGERGKIP
jgi:UDP-N-acetylglucosamine--N-acetylmuramyl-(pentapeptide) pyrophosphoryl-undecaprenol N-acetylglucosamine transferase